MTAEALPFPPRESFDLRFPKHSGSVHHSTLSTPIVTSKLHLLGLWNSMITMFSGANLQYLSAIVIHWCVDTQQAESLVDRIRISAVCCVILGVY